MKRKNAIATVLRLIGAVIFGLCLYKDEGTSFPKNCDVNFYNN